jgi:hypothetical protein
MGDYNNVHRVKGEFIKVDTSGTPDGYQSISQKINCVNGYADPKLLAEHIAEKLNDGWKELEKPFSLNAHKIPLGSQIRYVRKKNNNYKLIIGGFVNVVDQQEGLNDEIYSKYIMYRGNGTSFSLDVSNGTEVVEIIYKPKESKKKQKVIMFNKINPDNKFPVFINEIEVYRAESTYKQKRFMSSKKYQKAVETGMFEVQGQ